MGLDFFASQSYQRKSSSAAARSRDFLVLQKEGARLPLRR